jgi:hypothetical protein
MPDQSLDQQTNPTTATPSATPDQAAPAAQESSVLANAPLASEGQIQQADVTINQDPVVGTNDGNEDPGAGDGPADSYDDEGAWPYRALQQEAKHRDLDASGKREEIVARLREADAAGNVAPAAAGVEPTSVVNGGINPSGRAIEHASVLQGLSNERRAQQLASVREHAAQAEDATV